MKFFLDENFPKSCADFLNSLNHEVFDVRGTNMEGLDDKTLFKLAQDNSAMFLTTDKDFFHTIPYLFDKHYGVIVIALTQPNRENILNKLKWILDNFDMSDIANKVILLKDNNYSIKKS